MLVSGITGGCMGNAQACTPDPVAAPGPRSPRPSSSGHSAAWSCPASTLVVQPPGGKTLVNFDTLFRTEAEPFTRTVRLLGHRVDLEITPASFSLDPR